MSEKKTEMTESEINKAIREEAEKYRQEHLSTYNNRVQENGVKDFIEGVKCGLTINSSTNLEQQNTTQGLSNKFWEAMNKPTIGLSVKECERICEQEIKDAFNAGRNRLPMAWDGASEPMYDSADEYLNYINQ